MVDHVVTVGDDFALPAVVQATLGTQFAGLPGPSRNPLTGWYHANGFSGIDPSGTTDSTSGINALHAAVPAGMTAYYPVGTYKITGTLTQPATGVVVQGAGEGTVWSFQPAAGASMMTITNGSRIKFVGIQFQLPATTAGVSSRLFTLANTFRCTWTRCVFQGRHTAPADAYGVTTGHWGVAITANSGDNIWYDCDFLNLGVGIATDSIQNAVIGGKFGTCYVGIRGTTNIDGDGQVNAGMSLAGYIDFVSSPTVGLVAYNILVEGAAAQWWINQCWMEGADVPIKIGSGSTGPTQLTISNCKLAATTTVMDIQCARQSFLSGIQFSANGAAQPTLLALGVNAGEGIAQNLVCIISGAQYTGDPFLAIFPNGTGSLTRDWTYLGRTSIRTPSQTILPFAGGIVFTRSDGAVAGRVSLNGSTLRFNGPNANTGSPLIDFCDNANKTILQLGNIASGVNYANITNAATGGTVAIKADGTDTDIPLTITTKGAGSLSLGLSTNKLGFFGSAGQTKQTLNAAANDAGSTQILVNQIQALLVSHGIAIAGAPATASPIGISATSQFPLFA